MSLETIFLIGILTLLAICLGVSLFWVAVVEMVIKSSNEPSFLELIISLRLLTIQLMSLIFITTLICAIALNLISHSRSEPYLLKFGLFSFILSLISVLSKFVWLEGGGILSNSLLWFNLLCIIVSYWSFLHYALNSKIQLLSIALVEGDAFLEFTPPEARRYYVCINNVVNNDYDPNPGATGSGWRVEGIAEADVYQLNFELSDRF